MDDGKLRDIILEITGLKSNDQIAKAIKGTFNVVKSYISSGFDATSVDDNGGLEDAAGALGVGSAIPPPEPGSTRADIRLAYNINIVLPETSDLQVLNAIFRSIKENLMR